MMKMLQIYFKTYSHPKSPHWSLALPEAAQEFDEYFRFFLRYNYHHRKMYFRRRGIPATDNNDVDANESPLLRQRNLKIRQICILVLVIR